MMTAKVTGLAELERKMIALGPKIALKALRGALVSGASQIKQDAIARAPRATGRLKRAILIKRMNKSNPFSERVIVGVRHGKKEQKRDRDAYYWGFIEFGFKDRSGKQIAGKSFIRSAFESKKEKALDRIKAYLQKKISQFAGEPA
jgi:HK97 gp10 family phage protein